jgi:hypothetical protein
MFDFGDTLKLPPRALEVICLEEILLRIEALLKQIENRLAHIEMASDSCDSSLEEIKNKN